MHHIVNIIWAKDDMTKRLRNRGCPLSWRFQKPLPNLQERLESTTINNMATSHAKNYVWEKERWLVIASNGGH
jgi:hypothetical protein